MQPTMQKNNVKQRKTIAIIAMIAVAVSYTHLTLPTKLEV